MFEQVATADAMDEARHEGEATPWLDVRAAAAYLRFCEKTIRRACQLGQLDHVRVGNRIRIRRDWLDRWMLTHGTQ